MKKNKRNGFWLLALGFLISLSTQQSCKKMPLTNGDVICETRTLPNFNTIHINDNIDIRLIRSDSCFIEITAGDKLMQNIISIVSDSILTIRNDNLGNLFRDDENVLSAIIYYKSNIKEIYYHSIGHLHSDDYINDDSLSSFNFKLEDGSGNISLKLLCNKFNFNSKGGTCLINFEGRCDTIKIHKKGLGPMHFEEMPCEIANITLYRGNDIFVSCRDSLNAKIYDFGNIYYEGDPKIVSHISPDATGKIIKINGRQ